MQVISEELQAATLAWKVHRQMGLSCGRKFTPPEEQHGLSACQHRWDARRPPRSVRTPSLLSSRAVFGKRGPISAFSVAERH